MVRLVLLEGGNPFGGGCGAEWDRGGRVEGRRDNGLKEGVVWCGDKRKGMGLFEVGSWVRSVPSFLAWDL